MYFDPDVHRALRLKAAATDDSMSDIVNRVVRLSLAEELSGKEDLYRLRVGRYRIVYPIGDAELVVVVVRVGHRKNVYR